VISSILSALAAVAGLFSRLLGWFDARQAREDGKREAVSEAESEALERVRKATEAIEEARRTHASDATDEAFDKDFWRD
jgi:hypothetical protein